MFKQFHYPSNRQALGVAIASIALLVTLVILWLAVSTRTALMSRQLDEYDRRQGQIDQEVNQLWRQMGEVTAPQDMDRRMREAGFDAAEGIEFLVPATIPATVVVSPTLPLSPAAPQVSREGGEQ